MGDDAVARQGEIPVQGVGDGVGDRIGAVTFVRLAAAPDHAGLDFTAVPARAEFARLDVWLRHGLLPLLASDARPRGLPIPACRRERRARRRSLARLRRCGLSVVQPTNDATSSGRIALRIPIRQLWRARDGAGLSGKTPVETRRFAAGQPTRPACGSGIAAALAMKASAAAGHDQRRRACRRRAPPRSERKNSAELLDEAEPGRGLPGHVGEGAHGDGDRHRLAEPPAAIERGDAAENDRPMAKALGERQGRRQLRRAAAAARRCAGSLARSSCATGAGRGASRRDRRQNRAHRSQRPPAWSGRVRQSAGRRRC